MKTTYLLMLSISLTLAACQNNEAPVEKQTSPAATAPQAVEPAMQKQVQEKVEQVTAAASNAVEVTKEAVTTTAKSMQEQVSQANEKRAAVVEQLAATAAAPAAKPAAPASATKLEAAPMPVPVSPVEPAAAPVATPAPQAATTGDVAKGQALSRKCQACHNFNDKKKVGPGLAGVYNRKAGAMADTKYSDALAAGTWNWDAAHLAAWVCDSKAAVKTFSGNPAAKTKMTTLRICDPAQQADLIAYLKTL
jgi:cytochrome c